jgi:hypothetical protein
VTVIAAAGRHRVAGEWRRHCVQRPFEWLPVDLPIRSAETLRVISGPRRELLSISA